MKNCVTYSVLLFVCKNVSQFLFLFVNIKMYTMSFADGSKYNFHLYIQKLFLRECFIYKKIKNNTVYVRIKKKILRILCNNTNGIFHFWKKPIIQYWQNCQPIYERTDFFCLHGTIKWLNCVIHYLNVKIKYNWLRKLIHNFLVPSNEILYRKRWRIGLDKVVIIFASTEIGKTRKYFSQ